MMKYSVVLMAFLAGCLFMNWVNGERLYRTAQFSFSDQSSIFLSNPTPQAYDRLFSLYDKKENP